MNHELKRMRRVADMLVTGHYCEKIKYTRRYFFVDVVIFLCSVILCILAFVEADKLAIYLDGRSRVLIGLFSIFTLVLSYCANQFNWRVKAEKHGSSAQKYFEFKKEYDENSDKINMGDVETVARLNERYTALSEITEKIPDKEFLKIKKKHNLKLLISKHLDQHPSTSLIMFRIKLWFRDNFR